MSKALHCSLTHIKKLFALFVGTTIDKTCHIYWVEGRKKGSREERVTTMRFRLGMLLRMIVILFIDGGDALLKIPFPLTPKQQYCHGGNAIFANPVTQSGSNYRGDITEDEAFLWFDEALIYVKAGSGGAGASTFKFGKARQHVAPSGGSGGDGGNVVFYGDESFNTLFGFRGRSSFKAEHGQNGALDYANGLKGSDVRVAVPVGTLIYCNETGNLMGEISRKSEELVVATGGIGGKGNAAPTQKIRGEKSVATPPSGGEKKWLRLELKLVADIGLVGVPNAGKSTFLDAVTDAKPKIASYAFTTIVPNLGVCNVGGGQSEGGDAMVIADIPGLVKGASDGVGLGRGFLRHIERCYIILHIVNGNSADPIGDFVAINKELQLFSPLLASKPQVVVLNKIDIPEVGDKIELLKRKISEAMPHKRLLTMSAAGRINVDEVIERSHKFLKKLKADEIQEERLHIERRFKELSDGLIKEP